MDILTDAGVIAVHPCQRFIDLIHENHRFYAIFPVDNGCKILLEDRESSDTIVALRPLIDAEPRRLRNDLLLALTEAWHVQAIFAERHRDFRFSRKWPETTQRIDTSGMRIATNIKSHIRAFVEVTHFARNHAAQGFRIGQWLFEYNDVLGKFKRQLHSW